MYNIVPLHVLQIIYFTVLYRVETVSTSLVNLLVSILMTNSDTMVSQLAVDRLTCITVKISSMVHSHNYT